MWLTCQSATFDPIAKTERAGALGGDAVADTDGAAHARTLANAIANGATPR
jgi:hypothetical protein